MDSINFFEIQKRRLEKNEIKQIALNYDRVNSINKKFFRPKPIDPIEVQKHLYQITFGYTECPT